MTRGRSRSSSAAAAGGAAAAPSWKTTHTEFVAVILACTTTTATSSTRSSCIESSSRLDPLVPKTSQSHTGSSSSSSQDEVEHDPLPAHNAGGLLWWLQVAGISLLDRLLETSIMVCGFTQIVLVLEAHDHVTRTALMTSSQHHQSFLWQVQSGSCDDLSHPLVLWFQPTTTSTVVSQSAVVQITVWNKKPTTTTTTTTTTLAALRQIEEAQLVPADSHVVILPGDLIILNAEPIQAWIHQHRLSQKATAAPPAAAACSVLLVDVSAVDEQTGHPLKESAKQKKGFLAREEEEEIEYTALSFPAPHRLIWKQSKLDVEQDKDMVGSTPKLVLPRQRLLLLPHQHRNSTTPTTTRVSTDWNDVHCYILAPWVRRLVMHRAAMRSIQHDLIPLLVARQFRGLRATFGSAVEKDVLEEVIQQQLQQQQPLWSRNSSLFYNNNHNDYTGSLSLPFTPRGTNNAAFPNNSNPTEPATMADEYSVLAYVVTDKSIFRAHTLTSYLYANRELAHQVSASLHLATTTAATTTTDDDKEHHHHAAPVSHLNPCLKLPEASTVKSKFHTVLLRDATIGEKVTFKQCIVGRHTRLGAKCRLHNVVLGDYVTVGENVLLQNTVVASHAVIGDQCSLNDCVVGYGASVPAGTKEKGESWTAPALSSSGELL